MANKVLKFRDNLAKLILNKEKNLTWRLFDDKNLKVRDLIDMINWDTQEKFGEAVLTRTYLDKNG